MEHRQQGAAERPETHWIVSTPDRPLSVYRLDGFWTCLFLAPLTLVLLLWLKVDAQ